MENSRLPAVDYSRREHWVAALVVSLICTGVGVDHSEAAPLLLNEYNAVRADRYLNGGNAARVGMELTEAHITLYAIHIGDGAAPSQVFEVVGPTGGRVFSAHDSAGLDSIFEHIDRMEPAKMKPAGAEPIDNQAPYALAGLALLATHVLALFGVRYTPW